MTFFASLLGLWLVTPTPIPESGPIYPYSFSITQGEQIQRRWYWYRENGFFRLNEIYLIKGDTVSVSDAISTKTWKHQPADFNTDGYCNGLDLDDFVAAFQMGHQWADFDNSGWVNGDDFDKFMEVFQAGCE